MPYHGAMNYAKTTIVMAMQAEARPLIERLKLERQPTLGVPVEMYGDPDGPVTLVTNGRDAVTGVDNIGTQPATLAAWLAIERCKPDLLLNAGTAGGFAERGAVIGDVFLSADAIRFHDRRIPLPGFREYGIGNYPVVDVASLAARLGLKTGVVSTGNSLDCPPVDLEAMQANDADVKEMEAAAIAWVASITATPMVAVKAVTDLVDLPHPAEEQFVANLALASARLADAVVELLPLLRAG